MERFQIKTLCLSFIFILLISICSATDEDYEFKFAKDKNFTLDIPMTNYDLSKCLGCSCSLSLFYPNGSVFVRDGIGSNIDSNCVFINSSGTLGVHSYDIYFTNGVDYGHVTGWFLITPNGKTMSNSQGITYAIILIISLLFFFLTLYVAIKLPWKDTRNDENQVISINNLKWLKLIMWFVSYLILTFFISIVLDISSNYLLIDGITNIANVTFILLISLIGPLAIIVSALIIIQTITDKKNQRALERGIPLRRR